MDPITPSKETKEQETKRLYLQLMQALKGSQQGPSGFGKEANDLYEKIEKLTLTTENPVPPLQGFATKRR